MTFENFHLAYVYHLQETFCAPEFVNAPRGYKSRERLGLQIKLLNPRERVPRLSSRKLNLVFNFAEVLWYLSGRDDVGFPSYYAPSIKRYSNDGKRLLGTAYGPRIFCHGPWRANQWEQVVDVLRKDRDSKRAVIQIFDANELSIADNIDVACTLALQFFIREGRLHTVVFMRANDIFRGIISDVFSFTFLQEFMATELGLGLGNYYHIVGSYHVYASDYVAAERVLAEAREMKAPNGDAAFPAMPMENNWQYLSEVLRWEEALRTGQTRLRIEDLAKLSLPVYWRQILALFELYREITSNETPDNCVYAFLPPLYQELLSAKWAAALLRQDLAVTGKSNW
jgi:thymidylate synthase